MTLSDRHPGAASFGVSTHGVFSQAARTSAGLKALDLKLFFFRLATCASTLFPADPRSGPWPGSSAFPATLQPSVGSRFLGAGATRA